MKKNIFVYAASALLLGLGACSEELEYAPQNDGAVKMTVYASRGDIATRSILSEEGGNLNCAWANGDQLLVTDANGGYKGVLTVTDPNSGKFAGDIYNLNDGKTRLNYFYLGTGINLTGLSGSYGFDISSQEGTIASLGKYDALSAGTEVSVIDGAAYVGNLTLGRHFSFGHFTLKFPEGVAMTDGTVTISGANVNTKATLGLANHDVTGKAAGTITVAAPNGDIYVTLIPGEDVAPTFKATVGGKDYEGSLNARGINAGIYLRKAAGEGVPVEMTEIKGEDPSNPGNTDHWGGDGDKQNPTYEDSGKKYTKVANAGGWTVNVDIFGNGGFCTPITYNSNGLINGLLTSGGVARYFQWGRWLGFPVACKNTVFDDGGDASDYPISDQYLYGVNYYDSKLGYIWANLGASYGACWMGNKDWTPERVNNCSIIFGMVDNLFVGSLDYVGANEDCKWEDRSGNPCPDGYRLPTAAELEALIPTTTKTINGSHAEIKTVDGINYAMQWKVTSGSIPILEIKSVKALSGTISVDDPIFEGAKSIKLRAYGYMDSKANLRGRGSVGLFWSNESGTNVLNGTKGLGGKYLEIDFDGSKAVMEIGVAPRSYGAQVLPIKDPNAKSATLTPWLPLSGI